MQLRVLTFNTMAFVPMIDYRRLELQIKRMRDLDPDIIFLQEVWNIDVRNYYLDAFKQYHPFFSGMNTERHPLVSILKRLPFKEGTKGYFTGDNLGLLTLCKKEQFSIDRSYAQPFPLKGCALPKFSLLWFLESIKPKGFLLSDLFFRDIPLKLINVHLSVGEENPGRLNQVRNIIDNIVPHLDDHPMILGGDLNAHHTNFEIKWLTEQTPFKDSFLEHNPNLDLYPHYGVTWHKKNPLTSGFLDEKDQRVDYIFYSNAQKHAQLKVIASEIVFHDDQPISDHYGVYTQFKVG